MNEEKRSIIVKSSIGTFEFFDPSAAMIINSSTMSWDFMIEVFTKDKVYKFVIFEEEDYKAIDKFISETGYGVVNIKGRCVFTTLVD